MKKTHLALAAVACLSGVASAAYTGGAKFFLLGDFPTATTTEEEFAAEYFGKTYGNKSAACPSCAAELISTKDATGDFARMNYSLPSAGSGAYFANVGVMLPLDNLWSSANDLRAMTKVWFKARTTSTYADGINLKVNFDGPAFPFGSAGYTRLKTVVVTGEWTWYTIAVKEFAYASWMKTDAAAGTKSVIVIDNLPDGTTAERTVKLNARAVAGKLLNIDSAASPDYDNDSVNALKNVKMIQFGIDPIYGTGGLTLDPDYLAGNTAKSLDIDSVIFEGVDGGWAPMEGKNCVGESETIEDFNLANPVKEAVGITGNYAGGYWFAYSDTSSTKVAPADSAVGKSSVAPLDPADPESVWGINPLADVISADMLATFNKVDVKKHPYAGWAELGTSLVSEKQKPKGVNATGLKAISFKIRAGGTDPFTVQFDKAKLTGVTFKVAKSSVGDDVTFEAKVPFSQINANANSGDFVNVCVDITSLKQPTWYTAKNGVKPFTVDSLNQLSWALKLQKDSYLTGEPSLIQVSEVKFYGSKMIGVKGAAARGTKSLEASYAKGLVVSYSVPGDKAEIEVVRMDGSKVASFTKSASAKNLALPVSLNNGTYMVVVRGEGARQTVTLPVVGK